MKQLSPRLKLLSPGLALVLNGCLAAALVGCASAPPPPPPQADDVASSAVPEPFWDFNPNSPYTINYDDVDAILKVLVVDVGKSNREKLPPIQSSTGTRLRTKVKRETANEGNRFYFESFELNEDYKPVLRAVRESLENIPEQIPLQEFSREEQLAYWLNLHNITVLDEIVQIYPERNLKKEITGKDTFFSRKILNVSGVPLSLDDIQHTILRWNYDDNPLVIYGLYQGIIGGPSIRRWAYTGENVYKDLVDNAEEFINSNRGTFAGHGDVFKVSSYYARNRAYFPNWETDLKAHLMRYIEDVQRQQLMDSERLVADIDDWSVTDVYGSEQQIGGSFSNSQAAMLGAIGSDQRNAAQVAAEGPSVNVNYTADPFATRTTASSPRFSRAEDIKLPTSGDDAQRSSVEVQTKPGKPTDPLDEVQEQNRADQIKQDEKSGQS